MYSRDFLKEVMLTPRSSTAATVDLEEVRSYRTSKSRAMQARDTTPYQRVEVPMSLSRDSGDLDP